MSPTEALGFALSLGKALFDLAMEIAHAISAKRDVEIDEQLDDLLRTGAGKLSAVVDKMKATRARQQAAIDEAAKVEEAEEGEV